MTDAEKLDALAEMTFRALREGMITDDDMRRFHKQLKRTQPGKPRAKVVDQWVAMLGEKFQDAARVIKARSLPPNPN